MVDPQERNINRLNLGMGGDQGGILDERLFQHSELGTEERQLYFDRSRVGSRPLPAFAERELIGDVFSRPVCRPNVNEWQIMGSLWTRLGC